MDTRGHRGRWTDFQHHRYDEPSADLAPFVDHYWSVRWDLRGQEPYRQLLPPSVTVHVTFVDDQPGTVTGPARRFSHRTLSEAGSVLGVAFRPGCFRPFLSGPVSDLAGQVVPLGSVFGRSLSAPTIDDVETFLRLGLPPLDERAVEACSVITRIADDPALMRVDSLASQLGVGARYLQRLFAEYVGLGPKWCIRRYRLAEATARLADGTPIDWAALAFELGYADQAHFSRDFTAILGEPPSRYALRYP